MAERVERFRRCARMLYYFLFSVLGMEMISVLVQRPLLGWNRILVFAGIWILSFLLREVLPNIFFFFLVLPGEEAALFFLIRDVSARWILMFFTLFAFLDGTDYMRRDKKLREVGDVPWPTFMVSLVGILLGQYMKNWTLVRLSYMIPLVLFLLYLVMLYLQGLSRYLSSEQNLSGISVGHMVAVNSIIVSGIMILILAGVGLANLLGLGKAFRAFAGALLSLGRGLFFLLRIVVRFFAGLFSEPDPEKTEQDFALARQALQEKDVGTDIFTFLYRGIFIAIVLYGLYRLIRWAVRFFLKRRVKTEQETVEILDIPKKRESREKSRRLDDPETSTGEAAARRIYRKRVEKYRRFYVPGDAETTEDIRKSLAGVEDMLGESRRTGEKEQPEKTREAVPAEPEKFRTLTDLYNAVRYGNVRPDAVYLKKMKKE